MGTSNVSDAELEALLRRLGLIDPNFAGEVRVTASTSEGSESKTITV